MCARTHDSFLENLKSLFLGLISCLTAKQYQFKIMIRRPEENHIT